MRRGRAIGQPHAVDCVTLRAYSRESFGGSK
jgi:hypothetical protein